MDGARVSGAAMRRRERRLRSWAKHERMTVAMALAENLHHSRQKVEGGEHDGLRAQKTVRATGARPGVLKEPEPQGAVTVGYVAAPGPLLEVASMAGGDSVDGTALRFLVKKALDRKKEEEEQAKVKRQKEVAEHERRMRVLDRRVWADEQLTPEESYAWRAWAGHLPGGKRKRKKRRKRKLPKSSSSCCRRPCAQQRHVPAVLHVDSVFASVHRRLGHSCCATEAGAWFDGP